MARQCGEILVTGTVYGVCHYKINDKYFARLKSSLTRRQFKRNKCFEASRRSAAQLGAASGIASQIYRQVPKDQKSRALFQKMVGEVKLMIKEGIAEEFISRKCQEMYLTPLITCEQLKTDQKLTSKANDHTGRLAVALTSK